MIHCEREMFIGINEGKQVFTCEVCGKQMEERRTEIFAPLREFIDHHCIRRGVKHNDGHLCDLPDSCFYHKDIGCSHPEHPRNKLYKKVQ